ncbi:MAG: hypothetical protein Kow0098_02120 [Ignavibacteriaceae bacterium]
MNEQIHEELIKFEDELIKLDSAVKHIIQAGDFSSATITSITELMLKFDENLKKTDNLIKNYLQTSKDDYSSILDNFSDKTSEVKTKLEETSTLANNILTDLNLTLKEIKDYYDELKRINFPSRLDKIDSNISSIILTVQNVQTRIESVEKNINKEIDRIKVDVISRIDKTDEKLNFVLSEIESKFLLLNKENKSLKYLIAGLLILMLAVIYFIIFGI